jgi:hypothetical protein
VKRLNKFRIVPSGGDRFIPSTACNACSARRREGCAKRRAPAAPEIRNAVEVCAGSIALGDFKCTGRGSLTCRLYPILCTNAMNKLNPPKGVTVLGVSRKITYFSPQTVVISRRTLLFLRRLCLTNFNLMD